jgi:DNA polymerase-3 subunit beta
MKFKINRNHFVSGLAQVLNVVGSKATMPILGNVLIEAHDGMLTLTTTNIDLSIRCRIKAEVAEEGVITLPVRRLAGIVRELPSEDVTLVCGQNARAKITSGTSTFNIMGLDKAEFPPFPTVESDTSLMLEQHELMDMLRSISPAQSTDETRYILNGVLFKIAEGKLTLVATDGRRLALVEKATDIPAEVKGAIILPAKAVGELTRMLDKGSAVKVSFNDRRVIFQIGTDKDSSGIVDEISLYSKVVEGNYPNYQQVIPKGLPHDIKMGRQEFAAVIGRAALVCSEKANSVRLKFSANLLEVSAKSPDFGEAHEEMPIAYSGPVVELAFNPTFLAAPLKALTQDEIIFQMKDEVSPGVIRTAGSFVCVVMPVRLS